jgi:hypothetical protein
MVHGIHYEIFIETELIFPSNGQQNQNGIATQFPSLVFPKF